MKRLFIYFCFIFVIFSFIDVSALSLTDKDSKTYSRSKEEIISKYNEAYSTIGNSYTLYKEQPDYEKNFEGSLSEDIQKETIKQVNYFRWQYGVAPVSLDLSSSYKNQRCAYVLKKLGTLTHYPVRDYGDLLQDLPDGFLKDAAYGCGNGNLFMGMSLVYTPSGYVSDKGNMSDGVGHRLNVLNPASSKASVGNVGVYSNLQLDWGNYTTGDYDYYAWPNVGYAPIENLDSTEQWSVKLNPSRYSITSNTKVYVIYNNKTYEVNYLTYPTCYYGLSFDLPAEVISLASNSMHKFYDNTNISVKITGIVKNSDNSAVSIQYTTNLFNATQIDYNTIDIWYSTSSKVGYSYSYSISSGKKVYELEDSKEFYFIFLPDVSNATTIGKLDIIVDDEFASFDYSTNKLTLKRNGRTTLTIKDAKNNRTFTYDLSISGVPKNESIVNVESRELFYNGSSQELINISNEGNQLIYYSTSIELNDSNYSTYGKNTIPTVINSGDYKVCYYAVENDVYNSKKGCIESNIYKTERGTLIVTGSTSTFDGKSHTISVNSDDVLYSTDSVNWSTKKPSLSNVGELEVFVKYNDNNNYIDNNGIKSAKIIINKNEDVDILKGDLNFDKEIDIVDTKLLLLETFNEHDIDDFELMDMDENGIIDIVDVKLLLLKTFE